MDLMPDPEAEAAALTAARAAAAAVEEQGDASYDGNGIISRRRRGRDSKGTQDAAAGIAKMVHGKAKKGADATAQAAQAERECAAQQPKGT